MKYYYCYLLKKQILEFLSTMSEIKALVPNIVPCKNLQGATLEIKILFSGYAEQRYIAGNFYDSLRSLQL